jgi:hypothetical protein
MRLSEARVVLQKEFVEDLREPWVFLKDSKRVADSGEARYEIQAILNDGKVLSIHTAAGLCGDSLIFCVVVLICFLLPAFVDGCFAYRVLCALWFSAFLLFQCLSCGNLTFACVLSVDV